jgi:hypothetical protein
VDKSEENEEMYKFTDQDPPTPYLDEHVIMRSENSDSNQKETTKRTDLGSSEQEVLHFQKLHLKSKRVKPSEQLSNITKRAKENLSVESTF